MTLQCRHCKRRPFADGNGLRLHHLAKHKGKKLPPEARLVRKDDDDDSYAARAIQAELDHAMGIKNADYDWLVEPYK